jgi:hypothetical protein
MPLRIKPERGQVAENVSKPPKSECCDVFHNNVEGSNFANNSGVLTPKPGPLAGKPRSTSGHANVLTGEPTADDVHGNSICSQSLGGEASHVVIARNVGPALPQDGSAVGLDLAEGDGPHAGPFESETEAADAGKEVEYIQVIASGAGFGSRVF